MIKLRIKELCKEKGILVKNLAEEAGISVGFLSLVNSGAQVPSLGTLEKISQILDVEITDLFAKSNPAEYRCPCCGAKLIVTSSEQ